MMRKLAPGTECGLGSLTLGSRGATKDREEAEFLSYPGLAPRILVAVLQVRRPMPAGRPC